jgi:hypothetical protein
VHYDGRDYFLGTDHAEKYRPYGIVAVRSGQLFKFAVVQIFLPV